MKPLPRFWSCQGSPLRTVASTPAQDSGEADAEATELQGLGGTAPLGDRVRTSPEACWWLIPSKFAGALSGEEPEQDIAGYVPEDGPGSRFRILALTSAGSFRLLGRKGSEIAFDGAGAFDGLAPGLGRRMIRSVALGEQKVTFSYTVDPSGAVRIARARVSTGDDDEGPTYVVGYEYDDEGRLCRVNRQSRSLRR